MHRLNTMALGAALSLLVAGLWSGCSQKPTPPPPAASDTVGARMGGGGGVMEEGTAKKAGGSGGYKKKVEVGDNLPLAHVHAPTGGESFKKPMGWICTCQFGVPQAILMLAPLDDPELLAAAKQADVQAAKAGEKQCIAVVVVPGPKDDERMAAALKWQEKNKLDHTLVTVAHGEGDWRQLGAPEKLTILMADEANIITFKQVGYNKDNKAQFEAALAGKGARKPPRK